MRISWGNGYKDVQVTDDSCRLREIMGENNVTLKFSLPDFIEFPLGSFINYQGQRYTLNTPQSIKEVNSTNFEYTLIFGSHQDLLENYKLKDTQGRLKFPLTSTPREHLQVLINVLNKYNNGWSIGSCVENTEKLISYNHTNCYEALQMIANEFKTEWEVVGKVIHLRKVEHNKANPLPLSYGKGNGFVSGVGRNNDDQKAGFNVLYVQGGDRNIDRSKYGSKELLLPKNKEYTYKGITYVTDAKGLFIVQKGIAINNRKEESLDCSHIYPQRVGTVSEVVTVDVEKNFYDFKDSSIPADLDFSQCRMDGEKITIQFNSGMLSGREFEIQQEENSLSGYIHAERRFKLAPKEEDGYTMPNENFKPTVGDKYAVFGMMMPNAYISDNATKTGASWEMFKEACKHFYENHESKFTFKGTLDGIWAKKDWINIGGKIKIGGFISFSDPKFQPQGVNIRIVSVKDYINNPHSPIIELANSIQGGGIVSELDKIRENEVVQENLYKRSLDFTKRRFRDAQETIKMLEKAQLNFGKSINPLTVQTMSALVGDKSLRFRFVNINNQEVEQIFNYNQSTKQLTTNASVLQHLTLGIDAVTPNQNRKVWSMSAYASSVLDDASKSYYLYAKVNKTGTTGNFILSETSIGLEQVAGYYHLLAGVLNTEFEGARSFVKMYGFTEILPGQIKVDKLSSANGQQFIKLLADKIQINGSVHFTNDSPALAQISAIQDPKINIAKVEAKAYVDAIEIGGQNLVRQSDFKSMSKWYVGSTSFSVNTNSNKTPSKTYVSLFTELGKVKYISQEIDFDVYQKKYVLSAYGYGIREGGSNAKASVCLDVYYTDGTFNRNSLDFYNSNWVKKIKKIDVPENKTPNRINLTLLVGDISGSASFSSIMLEKGDKATDYKVSNKDIEDAILTAKQEAETATKAYADAQDNLKKVEAEAHADSKVSAEEQARILDATQKLAQAKAHAENKDTALKVLTDNYTDLKKAEAIQEAQNRINTAKSESKTAWESYANLKSSNAQQSAIDSAKAFALAKDNEKETLIKAYADRKVTKSERNAIKVAVEKSKLAEQQAKTYADGKVSAEEQARILDATKKLAEAKTYTDDLKIGGQNLLQNSNVKKHTNDYILFSQYIDTGDTFTLTVQGSVDATGVSLGKKLVVWVVERGAGDSWLRGEKIEITGTSTEIKTLTYRAVQTENIQVLALSGVSNAPGGVRLDWLTIVKGTQGTSDWLPSRADTETAIETAKQQAINQANIAKQNAENARLEAINAKNTAQKLDERTNFLSDTKINGNTVATGTLQVGNSQGANAGITGVGSSNDSPRFYAGSDFNGRPNAPFRVLNDGRVFMEKATIKGHIVSSSGEIGGFYIDYLGFKGKGYGIDTGDSLTLKHTGEIISKQYGAYSGRYMVFSSQKEIDNVNLKKPVIYIKSEAPITRNGNHTALTLTSKGASKGNNIALYIESGDIMIRYNGLDRRGFTGIKNGIQFINGIAVE